MGIDRIVLIGFRATGKSTCASLVAEDLGWGVVDLDQVVKGRLGQDIDEFVKGHGWDAFRSVEKEVLGEYLLDRGPKYMVIATGGGAVLHQDIFKEMPRGNLVVWLRARGETIKKRMSKDLNNKKDRPSLTGSKDPLEEVMEVLREREPLYESFSHLVIDVDEIPPEEVSKRILAHAR